MVVEQRHPAALSTQQTLPCIATDDSGRWWIFQSLKSRPPNIFEVYSTRKAQSVADFPQKVYIWFETIEFCHCHCTTNMRFYTVTDYNNKPEPSCFHSSFLDTSICWLCFEVNRSYSRQKWSKKLIKNPHSCPKQCIPLTANSFSGLSCSGTLVLSSCGTTTC